MTSPRRFEQDLPALLADMYVGGIPDYRDDLVQRVAVTRQRAAWTIPERWISMDVATTRVPAARMSWRPLGVLALLAILIAGALAVYVGSQEEPLPAPFGPARNGVVVYSDGGDILTADPTTGTTTPVITGPEDDFGPRFSRDGTRIVFARRVDAATVELFVALADGGEVTRITGPIALTQSLQGEPWKEYEFSPDGRSVLIASSAGGNPGISIAQTDGSGTVPLDIGKAAYEPTFRPPDGREIMFVGYRGVGVGGAGIYAVDVASGDVRTIIPPEPAFDVAGATWSPDGSHIAYWRWGGANFGGINAKTHIVADDGTGDRELPRPEGAVWNAGTEWSNDGTRLIVSRGYTDGMDAVRTVIVPADGSATGDELEVDGPPNAGCCMTWEWAPDDSKILVTPMGAGGVLPQVMIDVATGESSPAPWDTRSDPAWQRRAR